MNADERERDIANRRLSRRGFLGAAAAGLLAACTNGGNESAPTTRAPTSSSTTTPTPTSIAPATTTTTSVPSLASDPFTLGVASGDPLPDGVVLWTRVAPDPLEIGGGLDPEPVDVAWQIGTDENLRDVAAEGIAKAEPDAAHSVHVDANGLEPGRDYFYRFRVGDYETPIARTSTAPAPGSVPDALRVGHVSCSHYGAFWAGYRDVAAANPQLVVHCGDYIYERASSSGVRPDPLPEAVDLDGYRARYALYKGDADLQAAHSIAPWLITWDDHEVENNYQGVVPEVGSDTPEREAFLARRAAAYRAWWEHMPVRMAAPSGPDLAIYRSTAWGGLAAFHVLDTRQYRSDQICGEDGGDIGPRCDAAFAPDYTVLGADQEAWLARQLGESEAVWSSLVQQIVVQQWRFAPGNGAWNLDQWDGYPTARDRLLDALRAAPGSGGTTVLTGDVHSSWAGSLALDFDDPDAAVVGVEMVAPGVGSSPSDLLAGLGPVILENSPHVAWTEGEHQGFLIHDITPQEWRTQFRLVDDATRTDSPITVASDWVIEAGGPLIRA